MSSKVSSLHGTIDEVVEVLRRDHNMEEEVMLWLKGTFEMKPAPGNILPIPTKAMCMQFPSKVSDTVNSSSSSSSGISTSNNYGI